MLSQSFLLLWTVVCVGSQTTQQLCHDDPLCKIVTPEECELLWVQKLCPIKCHSPVPGCDGDWFCVGTQCVQVVVPQYVGPVEVPLLEHRTWSSARVYCNWAGKGDDADLVVPNNTTMLAEAIWDNILYPNTTYWMGGSDLLAKDYWLWNNGTNITDYTPTHIGRAGECIYIDTREIVPPFFPLLGNEGCGSTLPFVCEKK